MASAEERRRNIALNDLAKKIRLESKLKREMNTILRRIGREFRLQFIKSGTVLQASQFSEEIRDILRNQYDRAFKAFKNSGREGIKSVIGNVEFKQVEASIVNRNNEIFAENQSKTQSEKITQTNQRRMNAAIIAAIEAAEEVVGPSPSREVIARAAERQFLSDVDSRATATSITETQNPAETTKNNQMNALIIVGAITAFNTRKVWTTILDDRTRHAHVTADGQSRELGEPFEVAGELLRHPGDTSLGAGAANVINCRCSSSLAVR
jgi:hypothetical protein